MKAFIKLTKKIFIPYLTIYIRRILILFISFKCYTFFGQNVSFTGKLVNTPTNFSLKIDNTEVLEEFDVYEINADEIYNFSKKTSNRYLTRFKLILGDKYKWQLDLKEHFLFSENFRRSIQTDEGKQINYILPGIKTFRGYNISKNNKVNLSLGINWIYGKVSTKNGDDYIIEPLQLYDLNAKSNHFVVYAF